MKLSAIMPAECIEAGACLPDKDTALKTAARLAARHPALKELGEGTIFAALKERETLASTGIGHGIAIPHFRLKSVTDFLLGIVTVPKGVPFDSLDGEPVKLIVFIVGPTNHSNEHIRILSTISQTLSTPGAVDAILEAGTAEEVRRRFLRYVGDELEAPAQVGQSVFQIFIQNEDLFHSIVQVFAAMGASSGVVVETQNISTFLRRMPLFASFWESDAQRFSRAIIGVVDKRLTNETIRRIEQIAGKLEKRKDILLMVQDSSYCAGALAL